MSSSVAALMVRRREIGGSGSKDKNASVLLKCLIKPPHFYVYNFNLKN